MDTLEDNLGFLPKTKKCSMFEKLSTIIFIRIYLEKTVL